MQESEQQAFSTAPRGVEGGLRPPPLRNQTSTLDSQAMRILPCLPLLLVAACTGSTSSLFDYEAACGTARARAQSPDDVRAILVTLEGSRVLDDIHPKPSDVARHDVVLAMASIKIDGPTYPIPSGFKGRLPQPPDYAQVHRLQSQLAAACR